MDEYPLTISENRKVNIKPNTVKQKPNRPSDREETPNSMSKDKRTTTSSRRQQRHSTEIGSEYYRWWAVRSSLGFQTNENIAGLLLDGFHALLQHVVTSCGGEEYTGHNDKTNSKGGKDKYDFTGKYTTSSSSSSSSSTSSSLPQMAKHFSSSVSSPPGAEDMEGFSDFNNAIAFYTNTLWWMCAQPESGLHKLKNASPILQEFILRLIGYLRGGRSFNLNDRKRTFVRDPPCPSSAPTHVNTSFSFPVMSLNPVPTTESPSQFVSISHLGNAAGYPSYITPSLTPLMMPPKISSIVPNSLKSKILSDQSNALKKPEYSQNTLRIVGGMFQGDISKPTSSSSESQLSLVKMKEHECKAAFQSEDEPPNFLNSAPSKSEVDTKYTFRPKHDITEYPKWPLTKESSAHNPAIPKFHHPPSSTNASIPDTKHLTVNKVDPAWSDKSTNNMVQLSEYKSDSRFSSTAAKETLSRSHRGFVKDKDPKTLHHTLSHGTPLLFFPTQPFPGTPETSCATGNMPMPNVLQMQKLVSSSPVDGFYGQYLANSNIASNPRLQCSTYPPSDMLHSVNQLSKPRPMTSYPSGLSSCPLPLLTSRSPSISLPSMVPLFYSPATSAAPKLQTSVGNLPWSSSCMPPSYAVVTKNNGVTQSSFIFNQNNTMRDNFSLFRMYQDSSKPNMAPYQHPLSLPNTRDKPVDFSPYPGDEYKKGFGLRSDLHIKSSSVIPPFSNTPEKRDIKDSEIKHKGHDSITGYNNNFYASRFAANIDYNKENRNQGSFFNDPSQKHIRERDEFYLNMNVNINSIKTMNTFEIQSPPSRNKEREEIKDEPKYRQHDSYDRNISYSLPDSASRKPFSSPTSSISTNTTRTITSVTPSTKIETTNEATHQPKGSETTAITTATANNNMTSNTSSSSRMSRPSKSRRFVCTTCTKVFYSGTDLLVHRYEQHSHVCSECDGRFLSMTRLQQHKTTDHPQVQVLVCSECKYSTFSQDFMDEHKRSRHPASDLSDHTNDPRDKGAQNANTNNSHPYYAAPESHEKDKSENSTINPMESTVYRHKRKSATASLYDKQTTGKRKFPEQTQEIKTNTSFGQNGQRLETEEPITNSSVVGPPCPGSVFPSFNKTTSHHMTSTQVDNIVNVFSQVKDYCRFDAGKFLPSVKDESCEMDCKESVLVIDTSTDAAIRDQFSESMQSTYVNKNSHSDNYNCSKGNCDDDEALPSSKIDMVSTLPLDSSISNTVSATLYSGHPDLETGNDEEDSANTRKRPLTSKSRKKRRKGQCVKNPTKRFKSDDEQYEHTANNHQGCDLNITTLIQTNEERISSDFQIKEKSAQNNVIKTHTVWLDDYNRAEELQKHNSVGTNHSKTTDWYNVQSVNDNGDGSGSPQWKVPTTEISHKDTSVFLQEARENDVSSLQGKSDSRPKENDLNQRVLSLRERHRSHSLPPKKRGIRKSYRINGDNNTNINDSENSVVGDGGAALFNS